MTRHVDPARLSFGELAAERDVDAGLREYFLESESFRRLVEHEKSVALGNRGAGKSAIFKMIAERERHQGSAVIELAPDDYSYELLSETMLPEDKGAWAKQGAYAAAWKFLLYVIIMKELTRSKQGRTAGKHIYKYLRDNHANVEKNPLGVLISYLKRLEGVKIGKLEAGLRTRELQKLYRLEEINALVPELIALCEKRSVVVLIDELDKGWDASEDAQAFVAGLFHAAIDLNSKTKSLRVLLSLRRELYESIPALYDDAQKYRDIIEVIEWDEASLLDLITRRIAYSIPDLEGLSSSDLWNAVFAETLEYRQTKSFNYMVDRTLYRPRELIHFCTLVRDRVTKAGGGLPANYPIISEAEETYSQDRVKDIASEWRFQFPGLESVLQTFRGMSFNLNRDDLELHCLGIATGEHRVEPEAEWVREYEPEQLIDLLWRVGFLRAYAVGGLKARRRSGSSYLGPHQIASLNLANITRFQVHPMFRVFLGLKEAKGGG